MSQELIKNVIDSICFPCAKRILHFQLFTITSSSVNSNYSWIQTYLGEKKKKEENQESEGCSICFGLLDKFSREAFLRQFAHEINTSGIQFKDFKISLTTSNVSTLREKYIQLVLDSIPSSEVSLRMYNSTCLTVKEDWKILTFHPLELIVEKPYNHNSLFDVKIKFFLDDEELEADNRLLDSKSAPGPDMKPKRLSKKARVQKEVQETGFNKTNVEQLLAEKTLDQLKQYYQLPLKRVNYKYQVECVHEPIFFVGRYIKLSRTLPQTAWIIQGDKKLVSSIEEIIGEVIKKELSASTYVFTASGREDIDVKCLGKGRPFMFEIFEPKRTQFTRSELDHIQKLVNASTSDLKVRDLQHMQREETKSIREGQQDKTKSYTALCYSVSKLDQNDMNKLTSLDKVDISQKTPIRVLHRRSILTRDRTITDIHTELIDDHHFKIKMTTQAGTYVKEFVHGDLGRTKPSICTILEKECDILELDVEAVNLDFPPEIDPQ